MPDTAEGRTILQHVWGLVKWLLAISTVLTVTIVGLGYIINDLDNDVENASEARHTLDGNVEELTAEIVDLDKTIRDVIEESQNPDQPPLDNQAVIKALETIARIEGYLCGGPCPTKETP